MQVMSVIIMSDNVGEKLFFEVTNFNCSLGLLVRVWGWVRVMVEFGTSNSAFSR